MCEIYASIHAGKLGKLPQTAHDAGAGECAKIGGKNQHELLTTRLDPGTADNARHRARNKIGDTQGCAEGSSALHNSRGAQFANPR